VSKLFVVGRQSSKGKDWTLVKLKQEIARLGALLQSSEDEFEGNGDDSDIVEDSKSDNENEDSNASNDNSEYDGDSDNIEYYWSEADWQAFEDWNMTFHAYRFHNDYIVDRNVGSF
jgi:hypothetical protein